MSEPTPSDAAPVHEEGESTEWLRRMPSGGSVLAADFGGADVVADDYGWFGACLHRMHVSAGQWAAWMAREVASGYPLATRWQPSAMQQALGRDPLGFL